jgi:3-phosphoshikimate 1-carboxyvinyltransferase
MNGPSIRGRIQLRGDKSLSHRALMFAALAHGRSLIRNLSRGLDVATTRKVLEELGVSITESEQELIVAGRGLGSLAARDRNLYCGNSGTTLRLMMGILAGSTVSCEMAGDESLNRRPVRRVITPLLQMGADLRTSGDGDRPPVILQGRPLHGTNYRSPVASAQVKSAVLLAALNAEGETQFSEPALSRDHTERFLEFQSANIQCTGSAITVRPPVKLSAFECDVPGDISTAMFFVVAGLLAPECELTVENVLLNPTRTGALDLLREMGADISLENRLFVNNEPVGDISVRHSSLRGIDASGFETARLVDEVPILAVAAAFAAGMTRFVNLGELRVKESDRVQGIVAMLASYGISAHSEADGLSIIGGTPISRSKPDHRNDHRLAMSMEVMELLLNGKVEGAHHDVVAISAPEFYHTLKAILK